MTTRIDAFELTVIDDFRGGAPGYRARATCLLTGAEIDSGLYANADNATRNVTLRAERLIASRHYTERLDEEIADLVRGHAWLGGPDGWGSV